MHLISTIKCSCATHTILAQPAVRRRVASTEHALPGINQRNSNCSFARLRDIMAQTTDPCRGVRCGWSCSRKLLQIDCHTSLQSTSLSDFHSGNLSASKFPTWGVWGAAATTLKEAFLCVVACTRAWTRGINIADLPLAGLQKPCARSSQAQVVKLNARHSALSFTRAAWCSLQSQRKVPSMSTGKCKWRIAFWRILGNINVWVLPDCAFHPILPPCKQSLVAVAHSQLSRLH